MITFNENLDVLGWIPRSVGGKKGKKESLGKGKALCMT